MRKAVMTFLTAAVIAMPVVDATAAVKATAKKKVVIQKFTGSSAQVDRWGTVQVAIVVRKTTTTTGTKKRVTRRITAVTVPVYPNHTSRSSYISANAVPILRSEALQAQSARIDLVSGATDLSNAFVQSLQSAILKAKRA